MSAPRSLLITIQISILTAAVVRFDAMSPLKVLSSVPDLYRIYQNSAPDANGTTKLRRRSITLSLFRLDIALSTLPAILPSTRIKKLI